MSLGSRSGVPARPPILLSSRTCDGKVAPAPCHPGRREADNIQDITAEYGRQTAALNIAEIAVQATTRIKEALRDGDLPELLANYDNKGLIALAAQHLKKTRRADFESWLTRVLRNNKAPAVVEAIRGCLPDIQPQ